MRTILAKAIGTLLVVVAIVAGSVVPAQAATGPAGQVFTLLNEQRAINHLPALMSDPTLDAAAQAWAHYLATNGLFEHSSSAWRSSMISGAGWVNSGENIAAGYNSAANVMVGWMGSDGHRANILNPGYTGVGVGYSTGGPYGYYWVQIFATSNAPRVTPGNAPAIAGTTTVGQPLTASATGWPSGTTLSWAWATNGVPIPGATSATYVPTISDGGRQLSVTVTGSKPGYYPASRTSSSTPIINGAPASTRLAGASRYDAAVSMSASGFAPGVPIVYVASGLGFPDALSAAPAASLLGGPLLLTPPDALPASVRAELLRLQPARIVLVGGPASVSDSVLDELLQIAPAERMAGDDRFDASRAIVADAFAHADIAYIATGFNFPDALTAAGAAATVGAPVILVNGSSTYLDDGTLALLQSLGVTQVRIAGGPNSVSNAIQSDLVSAGFAVTRATGADRFDAAVAINREVFTSSPTIYLASGFNFPDALAGAALAGSSGAPLFISQGGCIPASIGNAMSALKPTKVVLLGGPATLNANVATYLRC